MPIAHLLETCHIATFPRPVEAVPPASDALDADDTLIYLDPPGRRLVVRITSVVSLLVYAAYLVYRARYTINHGALTFSLLVYAAELHGFFSLFFFFHSVWGLRGRRVPEPPRDLTVDVFITTYNEDVALLRQTVRAAVGMRHPHRTYVLDDGRRPAVREMAEEVGAIYVTRSDNRHAKAGNWNNAFQQTEGDVIVTFDADHVPRPDFLERTVGFFRDPRVALVQIPQQYHNLDSVQHKVNWRQRRMYSEQDSFFNLVMPGKDHWNAAFFCGTGAVLRREALVPLGGIMTDTITEDLHTSVELHARGWKSVYLNEVLVTGLAPVDLKGFEVQRLRWAEGNLKVAGYINPITAPGLTVHQRIAYVASLYHWTVGLPKFIYYVSPPWMLFSGTFPIANYDTRFLAIYLTFLGSLIVSYNVASRGKGRLLMDELFNMVSFFTLSRAVKRVVLGRGVPGKFEVTAKKGTGARDLGAVLPHAALLSFSALAILWSLMGLGFGITDDVFGVSTAIFWTLYNVALMLAVIRIGSRPAEKRDGCRFRANFAVESRSPWGRGGAIGVTADISDGGCSLLWPEELQKGERLPMRVHLGSRSADWTGHVVSIQGRQDDGWHRYGVRFLDMTASDMDLVNDAIFSIVVPDLFTTLTDVRWFTRTWRKARAWVARRLQQRAQRQFVRVPVRARHAGGDLVATARDVSSTGVSIAAPTELPLGTEVALSMFVPGRAWEGTATVVRCVPRLSRPGFDTWILGLRFSQEEAAEMVETFQQWEAA